MSNSAPESKFERTPVWQIFDLLVHYLYNQLAGKLQPQSCDVIGWKKLEVEISSYWRKLVRWCYERILDGALVPLPKILRFFLTNQIALMPKLKQKQTVVGKYARAQARSSRLKSLTSIFGSAPWRNKASTHGLSSFIMAICKGVIPEKRNNLKIKSCPISVYLITIHKIYISVNMTFD